MERLFLQMRYLAAHLRVAQIEGEQGAGKLLAAKTLHGLGACRPRSFVACPAAEFFHASSVSAKSLQAARGGTLYLTGIDALDHEQQGRLMHFVSWVTGQGTVGVATASSLAVVSPEQAFTGPRVLLVSSTRALRPLVLYGRFRSSLQQQLAGVQLVLPPLRDRREDIQMLAELFLARTRQATGSRLQGMTTDVLPYLLGHKWLGNVAELEAAIVRGAARATAAGSGWLRRIDLVPAASVSTRTAASGTSDHVSERATLNRFAAVGAPAGDRAQTSIGTMDGEDPFREPDRKNDPNLDRVIHLHIQRVLVSVNGNKLRAARLLGISRSTLYRHLDAVQPARSAGRGVAVSPLRQMTGQ